MILAVDGEEVHRAWQLGRVLSRHHAGDGIAVQIRRGTKTWEARVLLSEPPERIRVPS